MPKLRATRRSVDASTCQYADTSSIDRPMLSMRRAIYFHARAILYEKPLDRNEGEAEDSKRRSLGTHVWRRSDNKDALYQDCIGPSSYSKGQGIPCKVWGFLACGVLRIHVLDEGGRWMDCFIQN